MTGDRLARLTLLAQLAAEEFQALSTSPQFVERPDPGSYVKSPGVIPVAGSHE